MGVTFSHGAFQGSYSMFDAFRQLAFRLAGYGDLGRIAEYVEDEDDQGNAIDVPPDSPTLKEVMPKSDPLYPLFAEEDIEGRIRNSALPPLAKRLDTLADANAGEIGAEWVEVFRRFADGCRRAHAAGDDLVWDYPGWVEGIERPRSATERRRAHTVRIIVAVPDPEHVIEDVGDAVDAVLAFLRDPGAGGASIVEVGARMAGEPRYQRLRL